MGIEAYADNQNAVASCTLGQTLKLYRPIGYKGIEFSSDTNTKEARNGFMLMQPNIGEFTEDSGDDNKSWVLYKHNKSGKQVIQFISNELGYHVFTLTVQGIQVHDHASIAMGGPAFATYFTEPSTVQEGS
jgi:hypothetical protein